MQKQFWHPQIHSVDSTEHLVFEGSIARWRGSNSGSTACEAARTPDDLLIVIFVRAPLVTTRARCARAWTRCSRRSALRVARRVGYAEHAVVDAGGRRRGRPTAAVWRLTSRACGRARCRRRSALGAASRCSKSCGRSGCRAPPRSATARERRGVRPQPRRVARAPPRSRGGAVAAGVRGGRARARADAHRRGGRCSSEVLASVEAYDARGGEGGAGAWRALPPLPCKAWYAMSAAPAASSTWSAARLSARAGVGRARGARAPTCRRAPRRGLRVHAGRLTLFGGVCRGARARDHAGTRTTPTRPLGRVRAVPAPRATCRATHAGGVVLVGGGGPALRYERRCPCSGSAPGRRRGGAAGRSSQ